MPDEIEDWSCIRCGVACDPLSPMLCGSCLEPLCSDACAEAHEPRCDEHLPGEGRR